MKPARRPVTAAADARLECGRPVLQRRRWRIGFAIVLAVGFAVRPDAASVKVKAQFDKAFDFTQMRTWNWNPGGAGQVILARTQMDDVEAVRQRAEPVIMEVVAAEMQRRHLTKTSAAPDLTITYYLLLTVGSSAQTMGQFLPSVAQWGLPPFAQSTTALEAIERGSLVLDLSANDRVVWRGVGEAGFGLDLDQAKRGALLRDAIKKTLAKYPPKQ
jgi:hypothetical protein